MKILYFQKSKKIILTLLYIIIITLIYRLFILQNVNNTIVKFKNVENFKNDKIIEYDIIYSYTCHENIDSFLDTLKNLFYFNKSQKVLVIINSNDIMYNELTNKINTYGLENIKLYPYPSTKKINTYDILNSHIQNFSYCIDNNIKSKYFILLASNCLFHKPISMLYIENINNAIFSKSREKPIIENSNEAEFSKSPVETIIDINNNNNSNNNNNNNSNNSNNTLINIQEDHDIWHWPAFFKNKIIFDICVKNNINKNDFIKNQHEGIILEYEIMNKIKDFLINNNIKNNIENETVFEEILPITLYKVFTGNLPAYCCKVFWNLPNYTPTLEDINNEKLPCFKRVDRNYNNDIRKSIRERCNNYN